MGPGRHRVTVTMATEPRVCIQYAPHLGLVAIILFNLPITL